MQTPPIACTPSSLQKGSVGSGLSHHWNVERMEFLKRENFWTFNKQAITFLGWALPRPPPS